MTGGGGGDGAEREVKGEAEWGVERGVGLG